jgi:UDP-N-acetylmuramate dehydrogenase
MTLSSNSMPSLFALKPTLMPRSMASRVILSPIAAEPTRQIPTGIAANVSLSTLTSFQVGGPAEWFASPRSLVDLHESLDWARSAGIRVTVLGAGSNLLVSDRGLSGLVIGSKNLRDVKFDLERGQVTVGAGVMLPALAKQIAKLGWRGFEWAVGIPGTVGGAVVMNAGAHGGSIADSFVEAQVITPEGYLKTLVSADLGYAYRTSNLQNAGQNGGKFVSQATFQLQPGFDPQQVWADTLRHRDQRLSTQPYDLPSCGSVFRNPDPQKAAWLIDQAGLKGHQIGGAKVAQRHANFILNCGEASANDIFRLIRYVQQRVEQQWSLRLEPEVRILGDFQIA